MQNLVFYCLGLEFHEFVETLYIFCVQPCWIWAHCKLDGVVVLALKNGKRIFFEILWGVIWSQGLTCLQWATSRCLHSSSFDICESFLKPYFIYVYHLGS
jgi:hypothetical protein